MATIEVTNGEPHRPRRAEIIRKYPEIKKLYGYDPATALKTVIVTIGQLSIAYGLSVAHERGHVVGSFWVMLLVAYAIGAFASKWAGVAIHEASHNVVFKTSKQNKIFAVLSNIIVLVPSAMPFRRHHLKHHSHMGIVGEDNDLAMDFEQKYLSRGPISKTIWLTFYVFFATLARGFLRKPNREEVYNLVFIAMTNVVLWYALGPWAIAYLALSTFFGFGIHPVAGHFIHEHYIWSEGQETYSYYGPLNALTLNLGYHVEHHDFMGIPSSRLVELHEMAPEYYKPLHSTKSWTKVMWRFVVDPSLGHHSRFTRSLETYRNARKQVRSQDSHGNGEHLEQKDRERVEGDRLLGDALSVAKGTSMSSIPALELPHGP